MSKRASLCLAHAIIALALPGCLGIGGDDDQLSGRFQGITTATILSPTSAKIEWNAIDGYTNYTVYSSRQDTPIGSSVFNYYTAEGLTPGTIYSFSVSGRRSSGEEDGLTTQLQTQTWPHFSGPTTATATNHSSVEVKWDYHAGPTYKIYKNIGAPPTTEQLQGTPYATSQNSKGTTVGGLQSNTTYYFAVVATYPDDTSSLDQYNLQASTLTANYTFSNLSIRPTITTNAQAVGTPTFTVTGAAASHVTKFYLGPVANNVLLATINANNSATATQALPVGLHDIYITITDTLSAQIAYAVITNLESAASVSQLIRSVSATTPTSLTNLPTITGTSVHIGPYPSFEVHGSNLTYRTRIYHAVDPADTASYVEIGSTLGDDTIVTNSSTPLPQGQISLKAKVTALTGEYAWLDVAPSTITIKKIADTPLTPPSDINNGAGGAMGYSQAVGDFNCDGFADLAIGAPYGTFQSQWVNDSLHGSRNGAVAVFYGSAAGLIGMATGSNPGITPSRSPTSATNPRLIPAPNGQSTTSTYGQRFGHSLAAANINGDTYSGRACADLIVGAPGDYADGLGANIGAMYIYHGSSTGLQVSPTYTHNSLICSPTDAVCSTGKYAITSSDLPNTGHTAYFADWSGRPYAPAGFGWAVAAGDFNGDGYDDVAVSYPGRSNAGSKQGRVYMFFGTPNGLAPDPSAIKPPVAYTATNSTFLGTSLAFGYISDAPGAGRKKDLIIGWSRYGVIVVKGTDTITLGSTTLNANSELISNNTIIQPATCVANAIYCSMFATSLDVNNDQYDDIVFGQPYSAASTWTGLFFIYYGSVAGPHAIGTAPTSNATTCTVPGSPCNPQMFTNAEYSEWMYASALSNLGDVNGDGLPDLGVGAMGANLKNGYLTRNGRAYIYYSSSLGLIRSPSTTININASNYSFFGASIAGGRFRATTTSDITVGNPGTHATIPGTANGTVYFFENDADGPGTLVSTYTSFTPNMPSVPVRSNFESAVFAGDINGDGYEDVITPMKLTAGLSPYVDGTAEWPQKPLYSPYFDYQGFIIYYGSENGLVTSPTPATNATGTAPKLVTIHISYLMSAGDMNGDGFADVVGAVSGSSMYFFYGSATGLITSPSPLASPAGPTDPRIITQGYEQSAMMPYHGAALAAAGDYNGDGYGDFAYAVNGFGVSTQWWRPIYVIYGSDSGPVSAGYIYPPADAGYATAAQYNKSQYVSTCTNGMCRPTILCATNSGSRTLPSCQGQAENAGVYLAGEWWVDGWSRLISPGDMDRDGTDDLVTSVIQEPYGGVYYSSALYLFYGNSSDLDNGLRATRRAKIFLPMKRTTNVNPRMLTLYDPGNTAFGGSTPGDDGGLAKAYDVNGDGIADLVASSANETIAPANNWTADGSAYLIYGVQGGYKAVSGSGCAAYPCNVSITAAAGNTPDYSPMHLVDNINNSCSLSTNACNPLRFYPGGGYNITNLRFGGGILGMGDITGDSFSDVAVTNGNATKLLFIFSGDQSGLIVAQRPSTYPTCTDGKCSPYVTSLPTSGRTWTGNPGEMYYQLQGWVGAGDVDGDGKRDFFISSPYIHEVNGNGFYTGGLLFFR